MGNDIMFANLANMMKHRKIKHREKVSICKNYNGCPFEKKDVGFFILKMKKLG